jgi:hypothetical protein
MKLRSLAALVTVWRKDAADNWKNVVNMSNESPALVR